MGTREGGGGCDGATLDEIVFEKQFETSVAWLSMPARRNSWNKGCSMAQRRGANDGGLD